MRTLRDVIENQPAIMAAIDQVIKQTLANHIPNMTIEILEEIIATRREFFDVDTVYRAADMNSIVVLPDAVVSRFLGLHYALNTHFVPNGLPGGGLSKSALMKVNGKLCIVLDWDNLFRNQLALHIVRKHEVFFRDWSANVQKLGDMGYSVAADLLILSTPEAERAKMKAILKKDQESMKYQGLFAVEEILIPGAIMEAKEANIPIPPKLVKKLHAFKRAAEPYRQPVIDFRHAFRKDGGWLIEPEIRDGLLTFSVAQAVGPPRPDFNMDPHVFKEISPGFFAITLPEPDPEPEEKSGKISTMVEVESVADSLDVESVQSSLYRESYVFVLPRNPFFPAMQAAVDGDELLQKMWQEISLLDDEYEAAWQWMSVTKELKNRVIQSGVATLGLDRVLGFCTTREGKYPNEIGHISPVVAESYLAAHSDIIKSCGWSVTHVPIEDVLLRIGGGYTSYSLTD